MILDDVPNDLVDCTDLVILESNVNSISEVALITLLSSLDDFLCKEHRVFWLIESFIAFFFILVLQECSDSLGVKSNQVQHIRLSQLEERLEKDSGLRLLIHQREDLTRCLTNVERLEDKKLSQGHSIELNFQDAMELRLTGEVQDLLPNHDILGVVLILEENMIVSFDFEIVC